MKELDLETVSLQEEPQGVTYFNVSKNIINCESKAQIKAVRHVQTVVCDVRNKHQKNLLSAHVAACQEPYMLTPGATQTYQSEKPTKVLFESDADAGHPQVKMFISMMGCKSGRSSLPGLAQSL